MPLKIHRPPEPINLPYSERLIYLGGPTQCAPNWQQDALSTIGLLIANYGLTSVANPRRSNLTVTTPDTTLRTWETSAIKRAARCGAVLFWFAKQETNTIDPDIFLHFGRVLGLKESNPVMRLAVGVERGNIHESAVRSHSEALGVTVCDDLVAVCQIATSSSPVGAFV